MLEVGKLEDNQGGIPEKIIWIKVMMEKVSVLEGKQQKIHSNDESKMV